MSSMRIFVGSDNPVKVNAVLIAASETWPEVIVTGQAVPSGVPDQPWGDHETQNGAINRAKKAMELGLGKLATRSEQTVHPELSVLGVGLEGGVFESGDELWSTVWVAVIDQNEQLFLANGARFKVPDLIADLIKKDGEMGPVVSQLVGSTDLRTKEGMIGVVTAGFVDRTEEYTGIAKMALGLWYGRDWDKQLRLD